jgi:long-chain fatty acid transport protein
MAVDRRGLLAAASVALGLATASSAMAGAFGIREQSGIGLGLEFAGAAAGSAGVSSMYWNPATITMSPGHQSDFNLSYVNPQAKITPVAPTPTLPFGGSGEIGEGGGLIPSSYSSYQITDSLWVGLASTAPFGLITKPNDVWAGQVYSRSSKVFSANFNPIVGFKVNEWLSIAGGPVIEYFKTTLKSATGIAPNAGSIILKGDDVGFGATAGVTITPFKGTDIGFGYRSSIHHDVDGSLATPISWTAAHVNLNTPEMFNVGLRQAITDQLKLDFGFEFTNWSRLQTPGIVADATGRILSTVPLGYKDGYFYSLGAEYQWDPRWAFRVGVAYEESPIDLSNRSTRVPDADRIHAGLGATYRWNEKLAITASYSHIFSVGENRGIRIVPGNPSYAAVGLPFIANTDTSADIVAVALNYRWDDPTVAQAAPIIRKY